MQWQQSYYINRSFTLKFIYLFNNHLLNIYDGSSTVLGIKEKDECSLLLRILCANKKRDV